MILLQEYKSIYILVFSQSLTIKSLALSFYQHVASLFVDSNILQLHNSNAPVSFNPL